MCIEVYFFAQIKWTLKITSLHGNDNSCSAVIPFKYLVFSLEFSWVLDKIILTWKFALNLILVGHMLDLSLGNWQVWYEKVWAVVYLVSSDTKVLEIYLLKNIKMLHDEFLYDKAWIPTRPYMLFRLGKLWYICCLFCIEFCQALLTLMRGLSCSKIKITYTPPTNALLLH